MAQLRETVFWPDGWTTESEKEGVKVFSRAQRKMPNKIFLSESNFFCSLEDLYDVLYRQISGAVSWNKGIIEVKYWFEIGVEFTFLACMAHAPVKKMIQLFVCQGYNNF